MHSAHYAAITLGSNSFNMLVAKTQGHKPLIIAKYKRKVRLAEGMGTDGLLQTEVMSRGLDCLKMFGQMLDHHKIDRRRVKVIATATLRSVSNASLFCQQAEPLLGCPIDIISGTEEAELIYQGMVANTEGGGRRLVIDIGGASTEFITGEGMDMLLTTSVEFGCVTTTRDYFAQFPYQLSQFEQAQAQAKLILGEQEMQLRQLGWNTVVGASGTVQSVIELLEARKQTPCITLPILYQLREEVIAETDPALSNIQGLSLERRPTFTGGLAILIALFEQLHIDKLVLSGGALREGVLQQLAEGI